MEGLYPKVEQLVTILAGFLHPVYIILIMKILLILKELNVMRKQWSPLSFLLVASVYFLYTIMCIKLV